MSATKMYPESYIKELRGENAQFRTQRNAARTRVDGLTEEVKELQREIDELRQEKVKQEVLELAKKAGVVDPLDAWKLVDHDLIADDVENVPKALTALFAKSPWLVASQEK